MLRTEITGYTRRLVTGSRPESAHTGKPEHRSSERILLEKRSAEASRPDYKHFETRAIDTSPGGYRLEWLEDLPPNASVGELIALREEKAARWCVALIRWIRQEADTYPHGC